MNVCVIIRHNTELEGDIALAVRELEALASQKGICISSRDELVATVPNVAVARVLLPRAPTVAVNFNGISLETVNRIAQRSAFAQELFAWKCPKPAEKLQVPHVHLAASPDVVLVCASQAYLLESEGVWGEFVKHPLCEQGDLLISAGAGRLADVARLLLAPFTSSIESTASKTLRRAKKTTLHLSHDLHIYKAKFFPRMVRALLNIFCGDNAIVLDPYCGSGTALLEASLLQLRAFGCDLDPICVTISGAKVTPFLHPAECLRGLTAFEKQIRVDGGGSAASKSFPAELGKKLTLRDKREGTVFAEEIVSESARLADVIAKLPGRTCTPLVRTLASDAVTKKIRFRFVGVGNGKYTIEIVKQPILDRLSEKVSRSRELASTFAEIPTVCGTHLVEPHVVPGDARKLATWPVRKNIDMIVTSPPYLPASSGREHYSASRALAFYVLGMNGAQEGYFELTSGAAPKSSFDLSDCPEAERLMEYLRSDNHADADPQRDAMRFERKAIPTLSYLRDIGLFFQNAHKALAESGVLVFVVASQHVFYSHRRGEIEHIVSCRNLYGELASREGLMLSEEIQIELKKSAASRAKPRAKDKYFESVLVFRRA